MLLENHEFCVHGLVWGYRGVGMRGRKFEVCLCIRHGACSDMYVLAFCHEQLDIDVLACVSRVLSRASCVMMMS